MEPTKRKILKRGHTRWELDFGLDTTGKKTRRLFKTEAEADAEIERCRKLDKSYGEYWLRMTPLERQSTVATLQEINAKQLTLGRVWTDFQKWSQETGRQSNDNGQAYADVVEEFKRRKLAAGKTQRYVKNTGDFLMTFGKGRERQNIHEITPAELETWIDCHKDWSLSTRRTYMLLFSSLWEVAIAKGWATLNIVDRLEPVGKIGVRIEIYPNETTQNILAAALSDPQTQKILAPLVLGVFGCMRPEEIASVKALAAGMSGKQLFGWHDIDLNNGQILVRIEIAKTGDQRTIRLQPAAVEWLKLAKKLECPLPPVNERRLTDQCCEMIGLTSWIRDGLRKNCATHLRVVYKNDYDVVKDCGNSIRVLLKHYAALHVAETTSLAHWDITPKKVQKYLESKEWKAVLEKASKTANSTSE